MDQLSAVRSAEQFVTTDWATVTLAGRANGPEASAAFNQLCRDYWFPVYAWFRRAGKQPADAEDLTQEFFLHLSRSRTLSSADASQGRFRTFLRGAVRYFEMNDYQARRRQKRGGGESPISIDLISAEEWYGCSESAPDTPDRAFDRLWAESVLANAIKRLRAENSDSEDARVFEELSAWLLVRVKGDRCREMGERLGITPNNVAAKLRRLRLRFKELVFAEVLRTVSDPTHVPDEWQEVLSCLVASSFSPTTDKD